MEDRKQFTFYASFHEAAQTLDALEDRGADHRADVVLLLTANELAEVTKREAQVTTLLDCGMRYDAIKTVLEGGKTHDRSRES